MEKSINQKSLKQSENSYHNHTLLMWLLLNPLWFHQSNVLRNDLLKSGEFALEVLAIIWGNGRAKLAKIENSPITILNC